MSWQRSHWFLVPLTGKRDKGGHGCVTINNARIISTFTKTILCRRMGKPTICMDENRGADQRSCDPL